MSTQNEWQQRSNALNAAILSAKSNINTRSFQLDSPTTRQCNALKTLEDLLGCLQLFAQEHYNYFENLFFGSGVAENAQTCSKYPSEYVFSVIFDQISFDLAVITQAANQRLSQNQQELQTLEKADEITRRALQPVMEYLQLQDIRIVSYFKKDMSIRVIPYAPVALVGIPYTVACISQDFLAIPHEVGHYVYWHGTLASGRTVQEELSHVVNKNPLWCYRWLEETFADIYGCLTAGPAIALSFQDLQMRNTPVEFIENDEDHPVPILRPNIYTRVLTEDFEDWAAPLDKRWNDDDAQTGKWRERTSNNEFKHRNGTMKSVPEAMTDLNEMVDTIVSLLKSVHDKEAATWWWNYLQPETTVDTLYQAFAEHVDLLVLEEATQVVSDLTHPNFVALRDKWLEQGQKLKDAPPWITVLNAGGWATKGPQCEGSGTCD